MVIEMENFKDDWKVEKVVTVPKEWTQVVLGDEVKKIVGGGTPSRGRQDFYHGSIPWVTVKDMNGSLYKSTAQEFITEEAIRQSSANLIEENNVIVATRIALGRAFINKAPIAINQDLKAIYLRDSIYPLFFLYWYLSKNTLIQSMGSGSTVKGIRLEQLKKLNILLPPMREQKKIAKILSVADEHIEKTKQLIEKNKELKKVLMQQLFTTGIGHSEFKDTIMGKIPKSWKVANLKDISKFITKGSTPTTYGFDWQDQGIFFFKSDVVKNGKFVYGDFKYIDENAHQHMLRSQIKAGDILMTITGNIGRVALVPEEISRANINQHVARISVENPEFNPLFVFYWLSQPKFIEYYNSIKTGLAYPQISLKQVRETIVPIPSIEEQKKIAEILTSVDEQIDTYGKEKEKQIELKKALMQQLLTGKLRVTV